MNVTEALNRLLSSPHFAEFENRSVDVGILEAAELESRETAHTKLLAWLLNPSKQHRYGFAPLKSFMHMAWQARKGDQQAISPLDLDKIEYFSELKVRAEFEFKKPRPGRLDVLAYFERDGKTHPLLVVEYKVNAVELPEQTKTYAKWLESCETLPNTSGLGATRVFLTRDGEAAQDGSFVCLSYSEFGKWLEDFRWSACAGWRVVEELRRCVGRINIQVENIKELESEIELLRLHASDTVVRAAEARHHSAFSRLGISSEAVYSSPLLQAVSKAILESDKKTATVGGVQWREANRSYLVLWSRQLRFTRNEVFSHDHEQLWGCLEMQAPAKDSESGALILYIGTSIPQMRKPLSELADTLREMFTCKSPEVAKGKKGKETSQSQMIASLKISDKADAVLKAHPHIDAFVAEANRLFGSAIIKSTLDAWKLDEAKKQEEGQGPNQP